MNGNILEAMHLMDRPVGTKYKHQEIMEFHYEDDTL